MDDGGKPESDPRPGESRLDGYNDELARVHSQFLLRLYESLDSLHHPYEIASTVTKLLGEQLLADRCLYLESMEGGEFGALGSSGPDAHDGARDDGAGQASHRTPAEWQAEAWRLARGRSPTVVADLAGSASESADGTPALEAAGVRSLLIVPLHREGRRVAALVLLQDSVRRWSSSETDLAVYVANHTREVLERSRALRRQADSESRYRALFDSIDQGFFICEIYVDSRGRPNDYRFLEVNQVFEKLTGLREAQGRTASEMVPDLEPYWFEIYGRVGLTGEPKRFQEHSEAMGRWFDVYAFRLGGEESRKVAVLFSNITEQKRAEAERDELLRELELERSRLAQVFHEAPAAIATLRGPEHVFEMANPLYYRLVGNREVIGKTVREALPDVADQGFFELLDWVYETGRPYLGSGTRLLVQQDPERDPEEVFLDFVYQPLWDSHGKVSGIFVHAVDVSEHKRAEQALARAHDELEERVEERTAELKSLNAELESFNYSVSHDLRAPLRGIDGFSQILVEELSDELGDRGRHYLERVQAASARMGALIDALLGLSSVSRKRLQMREVDLTRLARSAAEELSEREPERKVEVEIEEGLVAYGDETLLRVALENLLGNSFKFTKQRELARVTVGSQVQDDNRPTYLIRDNGIGFRMEHADRLFVPFQRLQSGEEFEGTGIGLATVQRIIHRHGGRIWARGEPGKGSTIFFTLGRRRNG